MLESEKGFPLRASMGDVSYDIVSTGMEAMKVLNVRYRNAVYEFFLDVSDRRFFRLHTNCDSADVRRIIDAMIGDRDHVLDKAWFYRGMLQRIVGMEGNALHGLGLSYSNLTQERNDLMDFELRMSGSSVAFWNDVVQPSEKLRRANAYKYVRIMRGSGDAREQYAHDDVHNDGYFALRGGSSIQDHLHVIEQCREEYSKIVTGIEKERIACRWKDGVGSLEGNPFEFIFPNGIKDLDMFIEKVFSATEPFQLWGLQQNISEGYFKVLAVDLHAGGSADFEIRNDMMGVYLFDQSCGNIILRLLTNLQAHFDADTFCPMVEEIAVNTPD